MSYRVPDNLFIIEPIYPFPPGVNLIFLSVDFPELDTPLERVNAFVDAVDEYPWY